jgi:alkylation response protein AidB-like acyl-CoA dehydrogenase
MSALVQTEITKPSIVDRAEALEQFLGDPLDAEQVFSFKRAVEVDERDEYPAEACGLLDQWGFNDYYVPIELGGRLASFEELLSLVRAVARRDMTVAVAHVKTYLGAVSVWIGGSEGLRQRLAERIRAGHQIALALTERAHGADILSSETEAVTIEGGYRLSGEKWLINNATRSTALTVFARTAAHGSARGFSVFLVEKDQLDASSYSHVPRVKTHGIRGADISGIRFDNTAIPAHALIGSQGLGLELVLKGFQITRCIVPALSLGAADTALRATLSFALRRKLYGAAVFTIPHTRQTLVDAFIDLLICECQVIAATRALHVLPEQMTLLSAIVKYYVPTTIENVMRNLAVVLAARYYLRDVHWFGIFQKMLRDNAITPLFDGSTPVNLQTIALHLRQPKHGPTADLETLFGLHHPLPGFSAEKLELTNRGRNDIFSRFMNLDVPNEIATLVDDLRVEQEQLDDLESFASAKKYCVLHAAAVCVQMWIHNRDVLGSFFAQPDWLVLALDRLLTTFRPERLVQRRPDVTRVASHLVELFESNRSFSIIPIKLALTKAISE